MHRATRHRSDRGSLPVARGPIPFLVGGLLAHELAVLCAPEIAFALKVIDMGWDVDPDDPIALARHAGGRCVRRGLR